jgi:hypothetical protein
MGHLAPNFAPLPALAGGAIIGLAASASLGRLPTMTKAEGSVRA